MRIFDGNKLKESREKAGLTRSDVVIEANNIGARISENSIFRHENGSSGVTYDRALIYAEILGIDTKELESERPIK